jgi:hypothetical protein
MLKPKFLLVILAVSTVAANAQRKTLTAEEYTAKIAKACTEISIPRRLIHKDVAYNNGQMALTKLTVYEVESNTRIRETFSSGGDHEIVITLDDFIYTKLNDDPWEKSPWYFRHGLTESEIELLGTDTYWIERIQIDGKAFTVLAKSEQQEIGGKKGYKQDETFITSTGGCGKTVTTYGLLSPRSITRQVSSFVEHDGSIKIEGPIK